MLPTSSLVHIIYMHFLSLFHSQDSVIMERQISVDPISLKEPSLCLGRPSFSLMTDPPPLLPKFLSSSLPNSASSSPRFSTSLFFKKKSRNESHASPRQVDKLHAQSPLGRSKSCGDGRASSAVYDEFDLPYIKPYSHHDKDNNDDSRSAMDEEDKEKEFKCSSFCLFLPGLGKGKPVRPRKEESTADHDNVESRTVSMEKFECGSWASSADGGDSVNLYFDLPLELIQSGANDASSPVTAAFVFDKHVKGVLKNVTTKARKSHESARHVRFSASSPSSPSITPRLVKAREDFNAYLEAQSG